MVHNGEISSYDANRRYIEQFGYVCTMQTDTEVITYLFDHLIRHHQLPIDVAADVLTAPEWDEIDRMDKTLLEERVFSDYAEKYQYFLIMALIFVLLDFIVLGRKNKNFLKINIFGSETKSVETNR